MRLFEALRRRLLVPHTPHTQHRETSHVVRCSLAAGGRSTRDYIEENVVEAIAEALEV